MHVLLAVLCAPLVLAAGAHAGDHPVELEAHRKPTLRTGGSFVVRNVTIHSAVAPARVGDVLVREGRIASVGRAESVPEGAMVIDGTGKHLAPGVIDCHSHMAISGSANEGTLSITCDVDISDVVDADDISIWRSLAGGVTTARLLHGSANAIGGRHEVIKLKWGRSADELRMRGVPEGVKFALGENPKRANSGGGPGQGEGRFPRSRMGVEAVLMRGFLRAEEYRRAWQEFERRRKAGEDPPPPRRDVRLEVLAGILDGSVRVHSHCYRADEILMLLRVAERFGIRIQTLQHVLEGYKVAHEIVKHGAMPSTFSDWWAYKVEAYDATPYNGALMQEAGAVVSFNSDSDELVRRMYGESAKAQRYGGMDPVAALALVTLNPAIQLGIEQRVGSIEPGKDADLVLLDGDPLSVLSKVLMTFVDGELEFSRRDAFGLDGAPAPVEPLEEPRKAAGVALDPAGGEVLAIVGGTLHPVTSAPIDNGTLLIQGGRIVEMGTGLAIPAGARVVDATGKHVWPGMIVLDSSIGLYEIASVRGTVDTSEGGGNQPDVRASAAISAESAHIAVTRCNGVTRSQSSPQGGGPLMGQSCVIRLAGDTWEELLTLDRDMLHLEFPRTADDAKDKEKEKSEALKGLERMFEDARQYARVCEQAKADGSAGPMFDARLEALAPYAAGKKRIALRASNAQTILFALRFIEEQKLDAVLYGADDGWKVADAIARAGVPVVVGPVLTLPGSRFDPYDAPYANAAVLHRAGVRVAIAPAGDENPRNIAHHAAMAAAFGLPVEEAIRAITIRPAQVLGLEQDLGSLAPGKLADVVITGGHLLEITAPVVSVFIDGVQQPMSSRHTELYERYRDRLHRLNGR